MYGQPNFCLFCNRDYLFQKVFQVGPQLVLTECYIGTRRIADVTHFKTGGNSTAFKLNLRAGSEPTPYWHPVIADRIHS